MATVTAHSDFGAPPNKICYCFYFSPIYVLEVIRPDAMILVFWMLSFKPAFSISSFTFFKRFLSSSSLYAIRIVSSAYLKLLMFLPAILIVIHPARHFAWYSANKLNHQGDSKQPWWTPFLILTHSIVPCLILTVASWLAYRFLRQQIRWAGRSTS